MPYSLGDKSRTNLTGVNPKLVAVVERALTLSAADFGVHEGVRTIERQRKYVAAGVSLTMNSKHLLQKDGYGHAVDLVPYVDGELRWEWPPIYEIAAAMRRASVELDTETVWGGCWDRILRELADTPELLKRDVAQYCTRHPGPDFLDGPHFQLVSP